MVNRSTWTTRQIDCPEEGNVCNLLIEWQDEKGNAVPNSISCGNPKLKDLDNWACQWSCWDTIVKEQKTQ